MMYKNGKNSEDQNFWISYADLMAGLLFVFILLVGAIVIKYVFIQTDLQTMRSDLEKEKAALMMSEDQLADKKQRLESIKEKLSLAQEENVHLSFQLSRLQNMYDQSQNALKSSEAQRIILEQNLTIVQKGVATKIEEIALKSSEIEKLKQLLFEYDLREKNSTEKYSALQEELALKEEKNIHIIRLKDEELAMLEQKMLDISKARQSLVEELNITKVKIKNLTGIRIKVVSKLKETLGKTIEIDPKSGAMRFSSNILFKQGAHTLKEGAKTELSGILQKYIHTLLLNDEIRDYIDTITIEGHSNSDGTYLYNLELSQKRALSVMKFLYTLDFPDKALLGKYISASGRSYADLIYKNGEEDKDASRRIEIKFRIKNEKAIKELEKFLQRP